MLLALLPVMGNIYHYDVKMALWSSTANPRPHSLFHASEFAKEETGWKMESGEREIGIGRQGCRVHQSRMATGKDQKILAQSSSSFEKL